ncbi:MAG: S-adenosylmethionine:tRNA ribosyltransferase-isomerase, partial [Oscillospiraceae bacterium]|nr:S-adenosylmethionine:tRNA ribosyltransferase-isomerase [Oscillospiraceae bacterium]
MMKTRDFGYELPQELIAQMPPERRDGSRLMVIPKGRDADARPAFQHRLFSDLPELLRPGDCLVLNNSRVLPARLIGTRRSGGAAELLLLREETTNVWEALAKPAKRIRPGERLTFGTGGNVLRAEVLEARGGGVRLLRFDCEGVFTERLAALGGMPLPPYITRRPGDPGRDQTGS